MKTKIVKIGNSQGIRIPKSVLEQCGLKGEVDLEVQSNALILRSTRKPREGWKTSFEKMAKNEDDKLLDEEVSSLTDWDKTEWQW